MRIALLSALIGVAVVSAAHTVPTLAQTLMDRAQRDELFLVPNEDLGMAAAMRKARATLKDFLATASKPAPTMNGFAVKVPVRDGKEAEYFWIAPFERKGARFSGQINNTPRTVRNVKAGQTIEFAEEEIADWLYLDNNKMKGNYTACVLIRSSPKDQQEAFKKRFGLDCDA
jgi:uncharacterized protein YegJ (DUF2314 family)